MKEIQYPVFASMQSVSDVSIALRVILDKPDIFWGLDGARKKRCEVIHKKLLQFMANNKEEYDKLRELI